MNFQIIDGGLSPGKVPEPENPSEHLIDDPARLLTSSAPNPATSYPETFLFAVKTIKEASIQSDIHIQQIPSPSGLAPFVFTINAEVFTHSAWLEATPESRPIGTTGRFMLLHDPQYNQKWKGNFRIVTYIKTELNDDIDHDDLANELAWTWLKDALVTRQARFGFVGGTAKRIASEHFGVLAESNPEHTLELRASWTAQTQHMEEHFLAWTDMLASFAGVNHEI